MASPDKQMIPDLTSADNLRMCQATFVVKAHLQEDYHVRVLGSYSSLGWDYENGLVLSRVDDGASAPEWTGRALLPVSTPVEYKYVVCDKNGFRYSLSAIRRVFTTKTSVLVNDGEITSHIKYGKIQRESFVHTLTVQLETPPNTTTQAGLPSLGITLYGKERLGDVVISTRDASSKTVESATLSKELHEVASFHYARLADIRSLHFEVKSTQGHTIGRAAALTSQMFSSHHGFLAVPLLDSSFVVVGEVIFRYLVVTPFSHPHIVHTPQPDVRMAIPKPKSSSTLLIGHRGTGAEGSRKLVEGKVRSHIRENTVLSFSTAGTQGAQLVEFDVHLTSDLVPVIYHDFTTHVGNSDMPIHSMTYERFVNLGKRVVSRSTSLEDVYGAAQPSPIHDAFPTLREVLKKVPPNIGFNVEIKYPVEDEITNYNLRPVNRNIYLDCILWEIYEHAKDRFIVFSSFDPEICLMLAAKQPHYPVFFLTQLGTVIRSDPRSNSVEASIQFAHSAHLGGLVCPAKHLVTNPDVIKKIKGSGLRVCTWGAENNDPKNVHFQKTMGVDGVIVDHVRHIAKHWEVIDHA